ncbi:MAG: hypothetical protein ACLQLO_18485 [Mycobacterium sp.]
MSIITPGSRAIGATEKAGNAKPAILSAAVFIIVEVVLVAETIAVILLKEIDPRNPGAAPIAILLSMTLLANLGLVCSVAATIAAMAPAKASSAVSLVLSSAIGNPPPETRFAP